MISTLQYEVDPETVPAALHWAPVPVRWRWVPAGSVIVLRGNEGEPDGVLWRVTFSGAEHDEWRVKTAAMVGPDHWNGPVDPDSYVNVLVPVPERDGIDLVIGELDGRLAGPIGIPPEEEDPWQR
jgi:hypothetical protein